MIEASRPTTRPVASIITHFFSISAGLAEYVVMALKVRGERYSNSGFLYERKIRVNAFL
jgi:hypothetical protein